MHRLETIYAMYQNQFYPWMVNEMAGRNNRPMRREALAMVKRMVVLLVADIVPSQSTTFKHQPPIEMCNSMYE